MTEKRFTMIDYYNSDGGIIYYDNEEEMGSLDVLDKLNELSEKNEEIKKENERLRILIKHDNSFKGACDKWESIFDLIIMMGLTLLVSCCVVIAVICFFKMLWGLL